MNSTQKPHPVDVAMSQLVSRDSPFESVLTITDNGHGQTITQGEPRPLDITDRFADDAALVALRAQLAAAEDENKRLREECNGWSNRVASILSRVKDMHPTFGDLNRWEEEYEAKVQVRIAVALRARPDDGRVREALWRELYGIADPGEIIKRYDRAVLAAADGAERGGR